ncbi:hypothetical protein AA313_de0201925 [Arthrobotrys entomopaga]|nr:hypothetical protein AA313_de0201925 [Arthrobotrys entomopaga]
MFLPAQQNCVFKHDNTRSPGESKVFSLLSLKGKTAIVSGAGGGIGFAAVEAFAEAGANVALWYNSNKDAPKKADLISTTYGVLCIAYQVDVTDEIAVMTAVERCIKDFNGRLDIFVANAAVPWSYGNIIDSETEMFQTSINTNLTSVYFAAKAAGKHFRRQKAEQANQSDFDDFLGGSFIITSSMAGLRQLLPQTIAPYSMAKAALTHFAKCLAIEWVEFARVNSVSPGYITTGMLDRASDAFRIPWKGRTPMGREGTVDEVKAAYLYLASNASSFTTGSDLVVDGGYTCV